MRYTYKGPDYLPGIPARDLDESELTEEQAEAVRISPLYKGVADEDAGGRSHGRKHKDSKGAIGEGEPVGDDGPAPDSAAGGEADA